jgi:hypothetical protein
MAAVALSREREQLRYRELADVYGVTPPRTVNDLLAKLHEDRADTWGDAYARDQKRFRAFWEAKLGALHLTRINAAMVMQIAKAAAKKWTPRTHASYLRYLVDAFSYGERKLKWLSAKDNLSAVDFPTNTSRGVEYTLAEVQRLLPALEAVDVRAGWIGHVAWQTGRRLSAIRYVRKRDVLASEGRTLLYFGADTDKSGRAGEAFVVGRAAELTADLLVTPGAYVLGKEPPSLDVCEDWLRAAETNAEVPHRKGRAWHGLKRAFSSAAHDMNLAAKQSGTRRTTLETIYQKDWSQGKAGLAETLARLATVPVTAAKDAPTPDNETA